MSDEWLGRAAAAGLLPVTVPEVVSEVEERKENPLLLPPRLPGDPEVVVACGPHQDHHRESRQEAGNIFQGEIVGDHPLDEDIHQLPPTSYVGGSREQRADQDESIE